MILAITEGCTCGYAYGKITAPTCRYCRDGIFNKSTPMPGCPTLWICYQMRDGELRVEAIEGVPEGDAIDRAIQVSHQRGGEYMTCSRRR